MYKVVSIKIPEKLYQELEKRARSIGTNVQAYICTLIERHISKTKGVIPGYEAKELDLMLRLRQIVKKLRLLAERGFQHTKLSNTCREDIHHIFRDIVEHIEQKIKEECSEAQIEECESYVRFKELRSKALETKDVVDKIRVIAIDYEDIVLMYLKRLFLLDRCSLTELVTILYGVTEKAISKIIITILDLDQS